MDIPLTISKNLNKYVPTPNGLKLVVAVSGGADSVALLYSIKKLEIPCTIAHVNHQLRGAESDVDEQFVRKLAQTLDLPIQVRSIDVKQMAASSGDSIEMAARKARHQFFGEFENSLIALAHHADDQAETFLLKLARGAGSEGLSGMAFYQEIDTIKLIRPMLNIPRAELIEWLNSEHITWHEDTSNDDESYLRNKIRHSILPLFENELNPNFRKTVLRTMDILREENAFLDELAKEQTLESCTHPALKRRVLRQWLFGYGLKQVPFDAVEQILSLMDMAEGTSIFKFNDSQRVVIEYGKPRFEEDVAPSEEIIWEMNSTSSKGWQKDLSKIGEFPATASFCAAKIGNSLIQVRSMLPGDRMNPLGMQGSRKLQDIFTDLKIPVKQRSNIPLVTCREEIIWIPGYRTSRDWAVPDASAPSLKISIDRKRTN